MTESRPRTQGGACIFPTCIFPTGVSWTELPPSRGAVDTLVGTRMASAKAAAQGPASAQQPGAPAASEEAVYEDVCLDEMEWCEDDDMYYYQCPCGDMFELSMVCSPFHQFLSPSPALNSLTAPGVRDDRRI